MQCCTFIGFQYGRMVYMIPQKFYGAMSNQYMCKANEHVHLFRTNHYQAAHVTATLWPTTAIFINDTKSLYLIRRRMVRYVIISEKKIRVRDWINLS